MKRITTLIVSMLLIASSVWARTPEEAAAIASGFMSQKGTDASVVQRVQRAKSTGVAQSTVSLEYIQATKANDNAVYVFNHTDGGFVLVSAIDNSREVLGYNDNGRFDKNNIPKNMQFWLQMYADELASVDKTATRSVSAKAATSTYTAVSPILDCTWGQSWPYNEMCPTIGSDHAVTGCVATAISQIMYAHKHPAKGTGSHSYTSATNNITSSVNFGSTTYDWNNMLPYYDWYHPENYTDAQVSAVATLLYHVGVSSNMDYGVDGSGAYSGESLYNMTEYFDYDKAINPMSKDVMPEADILTAISHDLQLGRPVYISGSTVNNEGHAFVCDGIRQDGYLHINWGWDGYSDGYFALSALNPEDQGTGGSSDDSAFTQFVVVYSNIKPDEGGAAVSYITCDSYTRTSGNTLTLGASNVNYRLTKLMNNGLVVADGYIHYDIYNNSNQLQYSLPIVQIGLAPNYYYTNAITLAETLPSSMANGEYQLEVCYHDANGNIFPIWVAGLGELPRVAFSVSGNTAYFGEEVALNEFTIRVKKGASCDMVTSDGLYLWWWVTNQDGQLANLTLNADGWYTTTITSTASSINCLAVNTDVVNNGWNGHQQTINYTDITGDICLEIGAPNEYYYYDIYETSCSNTTNVITYELNGGVTNDDNWLGKGDMWTAFCADAGITTLGTLEEVKALGDPYAAICTPLATANAQAILDNAKWDWLEAYIMTVQNADAGATALVEGTSGAGWRYALAAFFVEGKRASWPVSADFAVAGTPEAFIPAWKHAFANPTEPTAEWVLNAPYKEGATFDGWYAAADFSGEKVVKIDATTTTGTLYAKWVEYIPTVVEVRALADDTETKVSGVVNFISGKNLYIQDATAGILVYTTETPNCKVGDKIVAKGVKVMYGGAPEVKSAVIESAEAASVTAPTVFETLTPLVADSLEHKYFATNVTIAGVTIVEYDNYNNPTVQDATGVKALCYKMVLDPVAFPIGSKVTVTAVAGWFKGFQFVGDAAGIVIPVAGVVEDFTYPTRHDGRYSLKNNWVISNMEDNFAANKPGSNDFVRGMAAKDGKMYFINRETMSIVVVDGETGEMLDPILLKGEHLFQKVIATDSVTGEQTWSAAATYPFNDIKFDQAGHCLIGACVQGSSICQPFQIYTVDLETGAATELINDVLWENPGLDSIVFRFDAFGVAGDVTKDGVIMAADATYGNWLVYRWLIVDGVVQEGEQIDCSINIDSDHTLFWDQSGFSTAPQIFPQDEEGKLFYVDGSNTLPMRFNDKGELLGDFINCPYGTAIGNAEGDTCKMNTRHNGLVEFEVNGEYFLLMAATNTVGNLTSAFALYKFADKARAFDGMEPLWYLPANGMGSAFNACRTAPVAVEVVGNKAYLYLYVNNNGYARYEFTVEGTEVVQTKGKHIWPILLDNTTVENNASKIISDLRSNDYDNFLYNWDMTYTLNNAPIGTNFHGNMDGYLSLLVGDLGWAGCGISLGANSASAAESLRQAIVDNPENYYLHLAIKSTDNYSHCFYIFGLEATKFVLGPNSVYDGPVYSDFSRNGEWVEFDIPMSTFAEALSTTTCSANMNIFVALTEGVAGAQLNLDAVYFYNIEDIPEKSYTIRVKKDDVSDMDLSNGLYLWWWNNNQAGQLANMTLGDDGWYTTTITTTANSINCLAVNTDVENNGWTGQQTIDHINITGDICLAIGAKDWIYNDNYNLYEIPCSPMEYTTEHDFEDTEANAQWRFVQNGQTNYWTIGSAAGSMDSGSNALYITSDGNNYTYNNSVSSTSWAYIPVTVTAVDFITFYWKGKGESDYDNLRVYLFPKGYTPIAGNTDIPNSAIQLGEYLSGQTDWQYFSAMAGVEGEYNLCLRWYNDGSYGEMPIAVDNMAITTPLNTTEYPLTYVLNEDGTATVVKCATDYSGNVSIPTVVTYNGITYTVTSIRENAFQECGSLTSVTIPNSVTSIGRMAFAYCWSLESVTLSENISSIEDHTFYDCESLTSITIPNHVTYVGENAFGYCHNLSAVTFGDNVTTIGSSAFAYCSSLSSVTIPASVSYIGYSIFESCNSLNSIVVESGNTTYDSRNNCNAIIITASNTLITGCQSTIIPETVTTIGDEAFYDCDGLTTIAIPNSVTSIGYYAFANCDNLSSVDLGNGVTTIREQAFYNCDGLTTIAIPNSVTSIGYYAFADCNNLSSVDLGNGVTTIGGSAFEYCYAMTSVTIPASVTEIGSWAFYNCPTIVMEGTTPPTISSSTFTSEATIFVPCTALDTYLTTSVWQDLNLQGRNYTVTLSATEGGYAQITASDCATNTVTIEAYPEERYVFTQWSDGNTDNPRILTLTEDIALTAEFTTLTYPVTNLVVTTNCGKAYASWEGDAPYYELTMYSIDGTVVLYGIVPNHYKDGVSNSNPYEEGDYYCQVRPMYSNSEGDYAGEAVQAPFTISADNCVDIEIHDLSYTITDETTVNVTWNSEAYVYHVQLYDYQNNLIADEYINTNSYSYTLPEMGRYSFYVRGYNEDQTQFSSWQNISFDIVYSNWEYDLNFVYGEQQDNGTWNDAYQRPILLYSGDYQTVMRIYPMPKYENSIIGTYFVENNIDNLYAGGLWGDGCYITYNGISTGAIQSGMVTIARNEENKFVVSFDLTDANGINYTNTCTIENMSGSNITDDNVTALSASQALTLTQNLPDYNLTTMPYMVHGVISRITSYDVNLYSRARFYISEDGSTTNEFYCYNTSWLNNTSFTTGDEIAEGDTVVIYGNLQNYQGTTPEIKGYVYQHFAKEVDESCYTLTVDATEGGYVSISPEADCYEEGIEVTLNAIANEGYQFSQWNDGSTENPRTLMMNSNTTLTAEFSRLTYVITNLVVTTDCGNASGTWECNAPWYDIRIMDMAGNIQASGIMNSKNVYANSLPEGNYIWWVCPMYSDTEGDYAGEAVEQTFTISLEGCIDPEIYDLTYTTTNDSIVNVTWVSEAPLFRVWMYDSVGELLHSQFLNGNNYCDTLSETGVYQFQIRSVDADTMHYTSPAYYLDINITIPETPCYTLAVNANDGGYVSVSPLAECYEAGTQVVITATPYENYEFVTWSDGNTENVRIITMTQDMVLSATFVEEQKEQFTLTLTAGEGGTVTKKPDQPSYDAGSVVTITAQANEGFEFVSWSDGDKNNVRHITMTQNVELNATFTRIASNYDITNLSVTSSNKRITAKWESIATRFEIVITDSNNEVEHSEKVDITDDSKVYKYTAKKIGTYTVTITPLNASDQQIGIENSKTVTLVMKYTLFISTENENTGTVNEEVNGDYVDGETVEIVATPKNGYRFKMWDDGDTNAKRTLVMNQDYYLTARFSRIPTYTLTIYEGENGLASMAAGSYTYKEDEEVTITPLPYDGYIFNQWVVNDEVNTDSVLVLVMDKDYTVMPTFRPNKVGVENIYDGITILVEQWTITVEATQAQDIALYDLVGHLIEQQPHTRIASFTVPSAGLYLIRTSSDVKKVRVE